MRGAPFKIAEDMRELEHERQSRHQKLLHRELWRGVEISLMPGPLRGCQLCAERLQMGFHPWRDLKRGRFDFQEPGLMEPLAKSNHDSRAGFQKRTTATKSIRVPPSNV